MTATCVAFDPVEGRYLVELGNDGTLVYCDTRSEANAIADDWMLWEAHATHQWMQPNRIAIAWRSEDEARSSSAATGHPLLRRDVEVWTTVETHIRAVPQGQWVEA